jgi:hypothetical protein
MVYIWYICAYVGVQHFVGSDVAEAAMACHPNVLLGLCLGGIWR